MLVEFRYGIGRGRFLFMPIAFNGAMELGLLQSGEDTDTWIHVQVLAGILGYL